MTKNISLLLLIAHFVCYSWIFIYVCFTLIFLSLSAIYFYSAYSTHFSPIVLDMTVYSSVLMTSEFRFCCMFILYLANSYTLCNIFNLWYVIIVKWGVSGYCRLRFRSRMHSRTSCSPPQSGKAIFFRIAKFFGHKAAAKKNWKKIFLLKFISSSEMNLLSTV